MPGWKWDLGIARYEETRDSGANFFFEGLPAGEYTFKYRLRANLAGEFRSGPAQVQSIYAPEFVAYSTERLRASRPLRADPVPFPGEVDELPCEGPLWPLHQGGIRRCASRARLVAFSILLAAAFGFAGVRSAVAAQGTRLSLNPAAGPLLSATNARCSSSATRLRRRTRSGACGSTAAATPRISPDVPLAKLGGFLVTADGARVVFRSDADSDGRFRLFSAPADGSAAAIPIDGAPIDPVLADVRSFRLTADGTRAIFLANLDEVAKFELYSVTLTGGTPTRLLLAFPS